MKTITLFLLASLLAISSFAQTQGVSIRSTNGTAFGTLTVQGHIEATNTGVTNTLSGRVQMGANNVASSLGSVAYGQNNKVSAQNSLVGGGNNTNVGASSLSIGSLNLVQSGAPRSIVSGSQNNVSGQNAYVGGEKNVSAGQDVFVHGKSILMNGGILGSDNNFVAGRDYTVDDGCSNSFIWSAGSPLLLLDGTYSDSFFVNVTNRIRLQGTLVEAPVGFVGGTFYGNGAGLSNVPIGSIVGPYVGVSGTSPYVVSNLWSVVLPDGATAFQLGNPGAGYASIFATNLIVTPDGLRYAIFTQGTNTLFGGDIYVTNGVYHGKSFRPQLVAATIVGATAQSTNLMEIQDGTSNILAYVDKDGVFSGNGAGLTNLTGATGFPAAITNNDNRSGGVVLATNLALSSGQFTGNGAGLTNFYKGANTFFLAYGDSLMSNMGAGTFPQTLTNSAGWIGSSLTNKSIGGTTTADNVAGWNTNCLTHMTNASQRKIFMLWSAQNDMVAGGNSVVNPAYTNLALMWNMARTNGFEVVAFTVIGGTDGMDSQTTSNIFALNNIIRTNSAKWDYLIDVDRYYQDPNYERGDTIHLTAAENLRLTAIVDTALRFGTNHQGFPDRSVWQRHGTNIWLDDVYTGKMLASMSTAGVFASPGGFSLKASGQTSFNVRSDGGNSAFLTIGAAPQTAYSIYSDGDIYGVGFHRSDYPGSLSFVSTAGGFRMDGNVTNNIAGSLAIGTAVHDTASAKLDVAGDFNSTTGTRTFTHNSTHTVITNTATLTGNEWTSGQEKYWFNGTNTILVDKTNGQIKLQSLIITNSVFPSDNATTNGQTSGQIWYGGTPTNSHTFFGNLYKVNRSFVMAQSVVLGDTTVSNFNANATSNTVIYTIHMAANYPTVGKVIEPQLDGVFWQNGNNATFSTVQAWHNTTNLLLTIPMLANTASTAGPWQLNFRFTVRTNALAANSMAFMGKCVETQSATSGGVATSGIDSIVNPVVFDPAINNTITITVSNNVNAGGNCSYRLQEGVTTCKDSVPKLPGEL